MISQINPNLANELRYALDVMEENSHLGLDDHAASTLRTILQRRIREAEVAVASRPAEPVRIPAESTKVLA